jgi:hypothetical protein
LRKKDFYPGNYEVVVMTRNGGETCTSIMNQTFRLTVLWHPFIPINHKNDHNFTFSEKALRQYVWKKPEKGIIALMRGVIW